MKKSREDEKFVRVLEQNHFPETPFSPQYIGRVVANMAHAIKCVLNLGDANVISGLAGISAGGSW